MVKRRSVLILFILVSLTLSVFSLPFTADAQGDGKTVYIIPLEGPVEKALASFLRRSFREAEEGGATAVILEINTPGGLLDAAFEISDLIRDQKFPVYAYVRNQAYSAGAYLALSCDELYMAPGSVIGAAEPRSLVGEEEMVDEKTLSAWTRAMVSVTEAAGKDGDLAAAMVRKEISIEGLVAEGELLTLSSQQAVELGLSEGIFQRQSNLLEHLSLEGATLVQTEEGAAERLARIITNPTFATILLTIAFAALVIEVMTAGFGVAGSISILSFVLFFGGHVFAGLAGFEVVVLFLLGLILLIIEAVLPNFGIVGGAGILAVGGAVVLSAADTGQGVVMFVLALIFSTIIIAVSFRFLNKKGFFRHIILSYKEDRELGYVGPKDYKNLIGKTGVSVTPLRPSGTADIDGKRMDVVSEGGYVASDQKVEVTQIEGVRVVVKPLPEQE